MSVRSLAKLLSRTNTRKSTEAADVRQHGRVGKKCDFFNIILMSLEGLKMRGLLAVIASLLIATGARAQSLPNGTYTFLWAGIDTSQTRIATQGQLPATLPGIGRLATGTVVISGFYRQRFVTTWTVHPVGAPDTTKRIAGVVRGSSSQGNVFELVVDAPSTARAFMYTRNGQYYLLPSRMVRIGLAPPRASR
jgi:hypothetical protein